MKRRKPLRRRTPLRSKRPALRKRLVAVCRRCSKLSTCDNHHLLPRGRGGKDNPENLIPLCRPCHCWVTDNPLAAEEAGLLLRWNHRLGAAQPPEHTKISKLLKAYSFEKSIESWHEVAATNLAKVAAEPWEKPIVESSTKK